VALAPPALCEADGMGDYGREIEFGVSIAPYAAKVDLVRAAE
jgi:hypothetical protein